MSKITTVMLVRNERERTLAALKALTRAHFDGDIVLVDTGSSDGVIAAAREFLADRLPLTVHDAPGASYAIAANRAVAAASAENVLLLDNDTELQPGALAQLLSTLESDASIGAVGPKLLYPTGQVQDAGLALPLWLVPFPLGVNARGDDHRYNCPRSAFALSTSCLLLRRRTFLDAGGFDERLVWGFEGADLALSLRKQRVREFYEPRAVCLHAGGATLDQFPDLPRTDDNRRRLLEKWGIDLLGRVSDYLERLAKDGPKRFLIYGTGDCGRHLANTLEVGGYEVAGFLTTNGIRTVGRYPAYNLAEMPDDLDARVLIGSPYVRDAENDLAGAGLLGGAALPILAD